MAVAAGQKLRASDLATPSASGIQTDSGTVTSGTYVGTRTGTSNVAGVAFTAPNSGNIMVLWGGGLSISGGGFVLVSFEIRTGNVVGSGTQWWAPSDNIQIQGESTTETSEATFYPISGLTPGGSYNIRQMYRANTGTGTVNRPRISVMPLLA
ncbi:MAG TPA: hypothetical protein VFQ42_03985 [Mycobacterium sp.]|nr:hypothetical protein [Mycobacterium sp.]